MADAVFTPGQLVAIKSNPQDIAAVIGVDTSGREHQYTVFLDGSKKTYFESQLIPAPESSESSTLLSAPRLKANLSARYIQHPGTSTLYSLNSARISYVPYQFRPVLRFIKADRPRLLIADSVGVGKTIEAGLILRELQARQDVRSVLVICPKPLISERKWQIEMKRFDLQFEHFDGTLLKHCISECDLDGAWPDNHRFPIIPYSLLNEQTIYGTRNERGIKKPGLLDLDPPPRFDLVIVDEAHRIANADTYGYQAVRYFCDNSDAAIFLTATPLQLGNNDLFTLLNLLRPDLIIDQESFRHMSEPNPFINSAIRHARLAQGDWQSKALLDLKQAESTAWGRSLMAGNPDVVEIKNSLSQSTLDTSDRVRIIDELEQLHTFSGIINRTRRRDIEDFTVRRSSTVEVPFTEEQTQLHDALLQVQGEILTQLHGSTFVNFLMTTIRRQASSCLFGLSPLMESILTRHISEEELSEIDLESESIESDALASIASQITSVVNLANTLPQRDPKFDQLLSIVHKKQTDDNNHRVMVFSSFRHTLRYLESRLRDGGIRVGLIHGEVPDEERSQWRERFALPRDSSDAVDVLLFSEVGCEGLDYQFCDCMVNYDLPWNPMRVEQRIGRIDRRGQKSEFVNIYNFITPGTVDADIYDRCLMRIGVFNQAIGDNEEILGDITRTIQQIVAASELSDSERKMKLRQLADNKLRLIQEEEKLEEQESNFFGINLPIRPDFDRDIEEASTRWLSPSALELLVTEYLVNVDPQAALLGSGPLRTLRINQSGRKQLLTDYRNVFADNLSQFRRWELWLKGNDPHISVTFDGQIANDNRSTEHLSPVHPLVRQAATLLCSNDLLQTHLRVTSPDLPIGIFPFAIFQWEKIGIRKDLTLVPVAFSDKIREQLGALIEISEDNLSSNNVSQVDLQGLDNQHYSLWSSAREEHRRHVQELVSFREESLTASHDSRLAILKDQLSVTSDEKLTRMRESQLQSAKQDFESRISELRIAASRADINTERIVVGSIEIVRS